MLLKNAIAELLKIKWNFSFKTALVPRCNMNITLKKILKQTQNCRGVNFVFILDKVLLVSLEQLRNK